MGSQRIRHDWVTKQQPKILLSVLKLLYGIMPLSIYPPSSKYSYINFLGSVSTWCSYYSVQFSSVTQPCPTLCNPMHTRPPCPSPTPGVHPNPCPLRWWYHPTTSSSVIPFSSCPQSLPASGSFQISQLFASGGQSIGVSASASVFQWTLRTDLLQDELVGSPCSPRDSQESSLTPQFKSTDALMLSLLYTPTLTSIHDHWKNHSFD